MIVEAPKKLHISDIRKLFLIYICFDIVTMSSSVESEKTVTNFEYKNLEWLTASYKVIIYLWGMWSLYVGETSRHLSTRIKEHLGSDKNTHIFKHF